MTKEPKPTPGPVERQERQDYSFEQGANEALHRITGLYEGTDRNLLVVINGSSINVGKTRLEAHLRRGLMEAGIYTDTVTDDQRATLEREDGLSSSQLEAMGYPPHKVRFLIRQGLSLRSTEQYRDFHRNNPDLAAPDLIVAIYRPDKPFYEKEGLVPVGDIIIRNELAVDKPR